MLIEDMIKLMEAVSANKLERFKYENESESIDIRNSANAPVIVSSIPSGTAAADNVRIETVNVPEINPADEKLVTSPLVGTFYAAPSPGAESFVKVGDTVKKGQVLGIIEAMKLMNEIESEFDGVIEAVLVKDESMVEFGQPMFRIR